MTPPDVPTEPVSTVPVMSEEEALALLVPIDQGPDEPLPVEVAPDEPAEVPILDMGSRTITLDLQVLSEILVELPGLEGVSLVSGY